MRISCLVRFLLYMAIVIVFYIPSTALSFERGKIKLFSEHYIKDQEISHCVPAEHYDFLYSSVKCYVPPNKRLAVLSISGSINYDGLTKLLRARCASFEANIATLYLGMCVANGVKSIKNVKKVNKNSSVCYYTGLFDVFQIHKWIFGFQLPEPVLQLFFQQLLCIPTGAHGPVIFQFQ